MKFCAVCLFLHPDINVDGKDFHVIVATTPIKPSVTDVHGTEFCGEHLKQHMGDLSILNELGLRV